METEEVKNELVKQIVEGSRVELELVKEKVKTLRDIGALPEADPMVGYTQALEQGPF